MRWRRTVSRHSPDYIRDLRGIAELAKLLFAVRVFVIARACATAFVFCLVATQGFAILLINLPPIVSKHTGVSMVILHSIPSVDQSWSLFAPNPTHVNLRTMARARYRNGKIGKWQNISRFFEADAQIKRFSSYHSVAIGLLHGANRALLKSNRLRSEGAEILVRTSAMVLKQYQPTEAIDAIEVELDGDDIPEFGNRIVSTHVLRSFGWVIAPQVAEL